MRIDRASALSLLPSCLQDLLSTENEFTIKTGLIPSGPQEP